MAKKSLGQNFLRDERVIEKIIAAVSPRSGEVILEVGPGEGALTEPLARSGANIIAVELDDVLAPMLKKKFSFASNVYIVHDDILQADAKELLSHLSPPTSQFSLVGNLPYNIASAVIRKFLECASPPKEMIVMVQKEVAERICAAPGAMSVLSVAVQYYAKPELLFIVPPRAFEPAPKVESAMLRITPNSQLPTVGEEEKKKFFHIVKIGFSARRKTLANNLAGGLHTEKQEIEKNLSALGLRPSVRAQELSVREWEKVAKKF